MLFSNKDKIFRPDAFFVLKQGGPISVMLLDRLRSPLNRIAPLKADIIVSAIGLNWNTTEESRVRIRYQTLLEHLMENLPHERKRQGGAFYVQIDKGKLAPLETSDPVITTHPFLRKPREIICIKYLIVTVGEYVGHDLKSVKIDAFLRRIHEIPRVKRN